MLETLKPIGTVARMWCDYSSCKFSDALLEMVYYTHLVRCKPGEYINFDKGFCSWHILGRNTLAQNFKGDWLFMTDTDHTFAPDMLDRLLRIKEELKAPVISAIYQYKHHPHSPVLGLWGPNDLPLPIYEFPRDVKAFPVGTVGAGGILIDREVFQKIAETGEQPFDTIGGLSEDYSFCLRCKRLGIPIYVCPRVETHHLVQTALSVDDYSVDVSNPTEFKPVVNSGGIISQESAVK